MFRFALLIAVALWATVEAQKYVKGQCPASQTKALALNPSLLRKKFFLRGSFNNYLFERDDPKCERLYMFKGSGDSIYEYYFQVYNNETVIRQATTDLGKSPYTFNTVMNTKFDEIRGGLRDVILPLELIATDGENYAVLYSCKGMMGPQKLEIALAYTTKVNDASYDDIIKTAIQNRGLDSSKLKITKQVC
ncbi:Hypothetical protein NTJ_02415 [Nesidiocoris tenuis]|uniref:Lipocalin/cytosolic fatty-acid binding domain-containing protein n=1 Tax=Nesidiocoris tenuis TaxID=355587 RepID=A0ABN7ABD0_9HEMI|nr:Hypothetical protein NTJ_02415 [Nesidiocoris tenuis]